MNALLCITGKSEGVREGASATPSGSRPSDGAQEVSTLTGFDPSRSEWATPEFREAERSILLAMYEGVDPDFGFFPFKAIASRSGVALDLVKPLVRLLAQTGEATFLRGLMNEDGRMVGSGYGLTEKGREHAAAIAIEAQRAVTTQIGTVRSTKARAESIAHTPIPSSRERK